MVAMDIVRFSCPPWLMPATSSAFGVDKLVNINQESSDGCDLGQWRKEGDNMVFLPTNLGFL